MKKKGVDENEIRKQTTKQLRQAMDKQVARREYRFQDAALRKHTGAQWELVAAAVVEANVNYHGLTGRDATNTKRGSKITFKKSVRNLLESMGLEEDCNDKGDRLTKLRKAAGDRTAMGNKLIHVARTMNVNAIIKGSLEKVRLNHSLDAPRWGLIAN